ncbi:T9SS type A sorting domain-containing protein [uncultured Pedobacter sp.]|uniref:T9SS type A sorting domain-containing protein n=1 Tax=uncultured Pedobacter sp. TaxID=246139 RepID=UPI002636717B|nr:T9SS type A sorting domain-containing protein [uncultured Pedobacter sp.]
MKKLLLLLCFVLFIFSSKNSFGQILAWDFYVNNAQSASFSSTYNNPDVESSVIVRGDGVPAAGGYSFGFSMRFTDLATDYTSAKANKAYVEFKVKLKNGYQLSLEGIDAKIRSTAGQNGAKYFSWAYWVKDVSDSNADVLGGNFVRIGNTDLNFPNYATGNDTAFPFPTIDLTNITDLQNVKDTKEVVIRLYGWGAVGGTTNNTTAFGKSGSAKGAISLMLRGVTSTVDVSLTKDQPLVKWNFVASSSSTVAATSPMDAQVKVADLSVFKLARGTGLTEAIDQRAFVSKLASVTSSLVGAEQRNEFYEIELKTGDINKYTTLSSLMFRYINEAGVGPANYLWKYSLDGGVTFTSIGADRTFPTNVPDDGVDLYLDLKSVLGLKNVKGKSILLRMYSWGGGTGFFGFGKFNHQYTDFSSIIIKGQITETPLPVTLTSFKATKQSNSVRLNWATASEKDNSYFNVLRAGEDKKFTNIGKVNANGTSSTAKAYSLIDYKPLAGSNYYQLTQTDLDGKLNEVGEVQHVQFDLNTTSLVVLSGSETSSVKATLTAKKADKATVVVYNVSGNSLYQTQLNVNSGVNEIVAPVNLNKGVYILKVKTQLGETWQAKFVR